MSHQNDRTKTRLLKAAKSHYRVFIRDTSNSIPCIVMIFSIMLSVQIKAQMECQNPSTHREKISTKTRAIKIELFSWAQRKEWKEKSFSGHTHYTFQHPTLTDTSALDQSLNRFLLKADADNSASGLVRKTRINLHQTPWLNWRWKVNSNIPRQIDETSKQGDDYAARVYLIVDGGLQFWKSRAINYVWAKEQAPGNFWPNPFTGNKSMMLALRNDSNPGEVWVWEKRNVCEDLNRVFGEQIRYIDAIAIMTDTDNTRGSASAYYRDMFFSSD